ncbi:muscle M-line assembly protein unc-89-like, partial [Stegastes partitus]|uniref:Muscle M-line assembly protein unc-89-like n=1 Tax=Stegastes partitus TaxID=144197 RepID=A0A9Y4TWV0_9TELE
FLWLLLVLLKFRARFFLCTKIFPLHSSFLQVLISKPSKASDYDEDELDDSDQSSDGDVEPEEKDGEQVEEPESRFGVTPFLSGVIPAGRLRARRKPAGCQAQGLIQVNGKSYNQARLLLGNIGSLHPANRLAAYVTGRLHTPGDASHKNSQKPNASQKSSLPGGLHVKAGGSIVPPFITARKTTHLKAAAQPPAQSFQRDSWMKGSSSLQQPSQTFSSIKPVQSFASSHRSSTSSPVSLTVSPALKSPSFLGQSGTYSFRICPPSSQGSADQKLPGVSLPGGFTLIQLPKPEADSLQSEPQSTTNTPPQKEGALDFSRLAAELIGLNSREKMRRLLSSKPEESGSSSQRICEEKTASDGRRLTVKQEESSIDVASEDFSSDSSDYSGDEDERLVDVETVEQNPGTYIAKMREALQDSRDSSDGLGRELSIQDQVFHEHSESGDRKKRKNHSVLERQRRSEQRFLFDKLQVVLQSDPRAPRLRLLSLAQKEIQQLVKTSRCLEERKEMLAKMQAVYLVTLSRLTGKPESLIKDKLMHICERQKRRERSMKLKPFFSQLLQSRAAFLQANPSEAPLQPRPIFRPPPQANPPTPSVDHNVQQVLALLQPIRPKPLLTLVNAPASPLQPRVALSPAQTEVRTPPSQVEPQPGEPVASAQVSPTKVESKQEAKKGPDKVAKPQAEPETEPQAEPQVTATPPVPAAKGASKPKSTKSQPQPPQPVPLPLFRTKNGRIILPSSLKPLGNGFYTLMVMTAKKDGEAGAASAPANGQPSDVDSSKNQEKTCSGSDDKPPDPETSRIPEDKTASSDCAPVVPAYPLAKLANLNKSIRVPLVDLKDAEKSQEQPTQGVSSPVESDAVVACRRGRPRKTRRAHVDDSETSPEEAKDDKDKRSTQVKKTKRKAAEEEEEEEDEAADHSMPAKRSRGRPLKKKPPQPRSLRAAAKRAASSSADRSATRPLTRGALGKDFPSAKKRSWIDIEKELDPDIESE